jgi:hypothetical protein
MIFFGIISALMFGSTHVVLADDAILLEYNVTKLNGTIETCSNPDQCLGLCQCIITLSNTGIFSNVKTYSWILYNPQENVSLFKSSGTKGAANTPWSIEATFNYNQTSCAVTFTGDQEEVKKRVKSPFAGSMCRYLEPFCCCKREGKELTGCQRNVTYHGDKLYQNFLPECAGLTADYKPVALSAAFPTCQQVEAASKNKVFTTSTPDGYVSRIDPKSEAKFLNLITFTSFTDLVGQVIKVLLAFIGSFSLLLYVYAGVLWMTANGESERIKKSKEILVWTTLGITTMLGSYIIVTYLFDFFK